MKFIVSAASGLEPPCEGAYKGAYRHFNCDQECWYVDINSLEDLLKIGEIVLRDGIEQDDPPSILVYDDYIE